LRGANEELKMKNEELNVENPSGDFRIYRCSVSTIKIPALHSKAGIFESFFIQKCLELY
jgi:hypothetical protein